jgi:rRNA maturation protein Nop10
MFTSKCPHCGVKLGNFLYADACPHCHEVLKENLPPRASPHVKVTRAPSWAVRAFFGLVRFVES